MQLKNTYSAREVAAMTGLTARQLQWWDSRRLFQPAVSPKRTAAGGFTERRYTPVDVLELIVLADLRRRGLTVRRIRLLLETLRTRFGIRLFDAVGGTGRVTLLTDGREIYARTAGGEFYNLLRAPDQPLLVVGSEPELVELTARATRRKGRRPAARGVSRSGRSDRGRRQAAE
ncbi:MAG TPA: MerR family transcriptional regulator [Vicinamibacterales bacterium]|nr:MerR family transcriptional regulator [Vicinamibacterales bacterium]